MTTMTTPVQRTHIVLPALASALLFTAIAGQFWRYLIGWWGYGVLAGLLALAAIIALIRLRPAIDWHRMPKFLGLFLLLSALSISWSFYPGVSALGVLIQWVTTAVSGFLALCLTWRELITALGAALRWLLGLSLLFELIVSLFIRHPVLPFWVDYPSDRVPMAFYWSRDLLFEGGQIQGILGNSNLLAMSALLALIVFAVRLADCRVGRAWGIGWLVVAALVLALSRSSTVLLATAATAVVFLAALWMRSVDPRKRTHVYFTVLAALVVIGGGAWALWDRILKLLGKSEDLTGRLTIWHSVIGLAQQRPTVGWGWVSYWAPWVEPFKGLAVRNGVTYLQAHDAWLDVCLQLGIIGLIIFIALVAATLWRSWFLAVDRPRFDLDSGRPFTAAALFPLLTTVALIAQSAAESRILEESGWMLLVALAVKTKQSPVLG